MYIIVFSIDPRVMENRFDLPENGLFITSISKYILEKLTRLPEWKAEKWLFKKADSALFNHNTHPFLLALDVWEAK